MTDPSEMNPDTIALVIEGAELKPTVRVAISDTILDLKWIIKDAIGVNVADQTLWSGDTKLCNTWTVEQTGIGQGLSFSVRLTVAPLAGIFGVFVDPQPTLGSIVGPNVKASELLVDIFFEVKQSQTVLELKEKIVARIRETMVRNGVPGSLEAKDVSLYRLGWFMQDAHKLSEYYVTSGSRVRVHGTKGDI